jgi:hypothetical protein
MSGGQQHAFDGATVDSAARENPCNDRLRRNAAGGNKQGADNKISKIVPLHVFCRGVVARRQPVAPSTFIS